MNVKTVISNIDNTILGKEMLRKELCNALQQSSSTVTNEMFSAVIGFLDVNLKELRAIKSDLEECVDVE